MKKMIGRLGDGVLRLDMRDLCVEAGQSWNVHLAISRVQDIISNVDLIFKCLSLQNPNVNKLFQHQQHPSPHIPRCDPSQPQLV